MFYFLGPAPGFTMEIRPTSRTGGLGRRRTPTVTKNVSCVGELTLVAPRDTTLTGPQHSPYWSPTGMAGSTQADGRAGSAPMTVPRTTLQGFMADPIWNQLPMNCDPELK